MKKPVIGITPAHNTDNDDLTQRPTYFRAIAAAGGLPLLLPLEGSTEDFSQLASLCDGFLFSGGPDTHPFLFGEDTLAQGKNVSRARDLMELNLLKIAMKEKKPILGICRGLQIINVGLGGSLYQDIPTQAAGSFPIAHQQPFSYKLPSHHVSVKPDSLLFRLSGDSASLSVNSMHHEAVNRLAPGLTACAWAPDGIIEALEKPDYPFLLGVQWHPEYLCREDKAAAGLFSGFIRACS